MLNHRELCNKRMQKVDLTFLPFSTSPAGTPIVAACLCAENKMTSVELRSEGRT
jgi:hypothetical protein